MAVSNRKDLNKLQELFFGTDIRTRHSNNYTRTFRKLLNHAEAVDTDHMVADALLNGSSAGILYRIIQHVQGEELIDSLMGFPTASGAATP